jgi:hypothetical protein
MLEYFPFHNFNKKIAVSLNLWKDEQQHYLKQTAIKQRNFRLTRALVLLFLLVTGIFATLARPSWIFVIVIISLILCGIAISGIKIWQQQTFSKWQDRNNRLFAQPFKEAIFKSFFDELQASQNLKTSQQVIYKSHLYPNAVAVQKPDLLYEGLFNNEPLLIYLGTYSQGLLKKDTAFFNLSQSINNNVEHFFCLKNQNLEKKSEAEPQHFGYFVELEAEFNFYSNQRGTLAAFIEQNEQTLVRLANLKLDYLAISILNNKINCAFDVQLLNFWQEIAITKILTEEDLKIYYNNMSKVITLISLAQNLEIPILETE